MQILSTENVYPVWVSFHDAYLYVGMMIEAYPPTEPSAITTQMFMSILFPNVLQQNVQ